MLTIGELKSEKSVTKIANLFYHDDELSMILEAFVGLKMLPDDPSRALKELDEGRIEIFSCRNEL